HLGFVENEATRENPAPVSAANTATSIPAGSATVGGAVQTIIPGRSNDLGGGNRGGNSDIGAMGI
ncbi:MAG: hypothetical protein C5B49_14010, partial [Bdellovibrio sp.]